MFTDIGRQDVLVSWLYLFRSVILSSVNALREHISCRLWQYLLLFTYQNKSINSPGNGIGRLYHKIFCTMDDGISRNYKLMTNDRQHQVNQNVITYHIRHPSVLAYLIMRPPNRINAGISKCLDISQSSESCVLNFCTTKCKGYQD